MSKAIPPYEVRNEFFDYLQGMVEYWATMPNETTKSRLDGLVFSFLVLLDGCSMELPAIDLVLRPHPDDEDFHKSEGTDWYEDGQIINDCQSLHELWSKR